jgi:hypothetical protein
LQMRASIGFVCSVRICSICETEPPRPFCIAMVCHERGGRQGRGVRRSETVSVDGQPPCDN